jgi:imidazole glycerol phosphate synthase subunit HisF
LEIEAYEKSEADRVIRLAISAFSRQQVTHASAVAVAVVAAVVAVVLVVATA